jgi:hypothetical protein
MEPTEKKVTITCPKCGTQKAGNPHNPVIASGPKKTIKLFCFKCCKNLNHTIVRS